MKAMSEYVLEVENLEVSYGSTPVLHDVSFTLAPGERLGIVGQSGSGKSTTVSAVLGLLAGNGRITQGRIRFAGEDITNAPDKAMRPLRGTRIALVPQDPMSNLNPTMRVGEQIADALRAYGMSDRAEIERSVVRLMTEAGIPDAERRRKQYPHEFSGGMRQRILIAIALAGEPDLLVADEPTSALDVTVQKQILDHLQKLVSERGTSLLFITHDLGVAGDRTDTILVMHNGRVVERGTPRQVLLQPEDDYTQQLVAAAPKLTPLTGESTRVDAAAADAGSAADAASAAAVEPVVAVEDLTKIYRLRGAGGSVTAVDHVSFTADRGQTTAIIGESGSGKSTIAKILLGLEEATSGEVFLGGHPVRTKSRSERRVLKRFAQPVFQDPYSSLNPAWSIGAIVAEPLNVFGIGTKAERKRRVAELLDQVALPADTIERHPSELSGGQRQRVAIARAISSQPELLICDEAVSALDVLVQEQILDLLQNLQAELGLSCLFITHDLAVVANFAQHVVVLQHGKLIETGETAQVIAHPAEEYTRRLIEAVPGEEFTHA